MDEGALFGKGAVNNNKVRFPAKAIKDTLLYCIPESFSGTYDNHETFADFVEVEDTARLRQAVSSTNEQNDLTTSKVRTLLTGDALLRKKQKPSRMLRSKWLKRMSLHC